MHGGNYPKATKLKATPKVFDILGLRCDNSHAHSAWGVKKTQGKWKFDTADEAIYPKILVQRMVDCAISHLPAELLTGTWKQFRLDLLQQAGLQHRLQAPLVPEYETVEWLPHVPAAPPCKVLQTPWIAGEKDEGVETLKANLCTRLDFIFHLRGMLNEHCDCNILHPNMHWFRTV